MLCLLFLLVAGVALRKESVDRNIFPPVDTSSVKVALRKESVDRNNGRRYDFGRADGVALRKESVDRNSAGRESDTED